MFLNSLSINAYKNILDIFFYQKSKNILHHASIFKVNHTLLLDNFINSFCELLLNESIEDYQNSPYITIIKIENDEIKISEIKKITKKCELMAHNNLAKIIIIPDLELLNDSAANALLKTLEEPMKDTFFLMFTCNYSSVLATVKSRSLSYDIVFNRDDKYKYLSHIFKMSNSAISKSLILAHGDINIVVKIKLEPSFWKIRNSLIKVLTKQLSLNIFFKEVSPNFKDTLYWLTSIIIDVYNYILGVNEMNIANYDKLTIIRYLATKLDINITYKFYQQTLEAKKYFINYKNVDKELVLENIIFDIINR